MTQTPDWEQISPYRQIRLRTEYAYGSRDPHTQPVLEYDKNGPYVVETTWIPAIFTVFREIIDNALDEIVTHKNGNRIDITYDQDNMVFSVEDNGKGIPIEWSEKHKQHAATVLLSGMFAGRNYKELYGEERGETRGLNGMGAKGVNYCSEWFQVMVKRDKQTFEQMFREDEELIIEEPIIFPDNVKKTGTKIKFKLSEKVFIQRILSDSFVESRIKEIAFCYPSLHITYNGKRIQTKEGLFGTKKPIVFDMDFEAFKGKFWLVPNFIKDTGTDFSFSLVNAIPLFNGGTHLDAFRKGFYAKLLLALEKENKKRKLTPNRTDVADGLLIYNIMEMSSPSFDSQAKTRLINENVGNFVTKAIDMDLVQSIIKKYPEWIDDIYARCAERTKKLDDKDVKAAKKQLKQKVEDLEDACGSDRMKCSLFLAEGKSAASGITEAGNKEIHGSLPLRGKVKNVWGESIKDILANEALSKIMNSIHLIPGERPNRRSLRYGKVYIATDADEDGKNIAALLINFFYTCWPDLFDADKEPFIYVFNTPLIVAAKGKNRKYWYADTYHEFDSEKEKGWEITRAKGLAALKRDDWNHILANPQAIPIVDDGQLKETLNLLFDKTVGKADDRKEWIGLG